MIWSSGTTDYVVLQNPQEKANRLPPPRTLIMDFTGPDGSLKTVVRVTVRHYHQLYLNRLDPIAFFPVSVDTSVRIYDDFSRQLFLHTHREVSTLENELPLINFSSFVRLV